MNAIVPLNIAALRVNNNDKTNVVSNFQGKTASFENMPWYNPNAGAPPQEASTGDKIYNPLTVVGGNPGISPDFPLEVGVHLQWELPDYFRKGVQPAEGGNLVFPAAPNRWLVTRYLSIYDANSKTYGDITTMSWVVESDYLSDSLPIAENGIVRPAISVPIPAEPGYRVQPYKYMGRVVAYSDWDPSSESANNYLPAYTGNDNQPLFLTSIGFVGAYFNSYYPECRSVFGFWDNFADVSYEGGTLYQALSNNSSVQFRASYQVVGWLQEVENDPLTNIDEQITTAYNNYLADCTANKVEPELNPTDFFNRIATQDLHWSFNLDEVSYTLNPDNSIKSLDYPERSICAGTAQEVVWDMLSNPGTSYFLKSNNQSNPAAWTSQVEIAVGNSTIEALSAILKYDMQGNGEQAGNNEEVLSNYELLLDALQLGLLSEIEQQPNKLIMLEEALHSNGFSGIFSGYLWIVTQNQEAIQGGNPNPNDEVTLPLDLAEKLHLLNRAQKDYDMGREGLDLMRKQLFMDWTHYVKLFCGEITDPNIDQNELANFIATSNAGELNAVVDQGNAVGILQYTTDPVTGVITGLETPGSTVGTSSLAYAVWTNYHNVLQALTAYPEWTLQTAKAPSFYEPAEPVVLMEGDMMEPVARNGDADTVFVRLSQELLDTLALRFDSNDFKVAVSQLSGLPIISDNTPMQADVQGLIGEAYLLTPMLATVVAAALAAQGGGNNPAVSSLDDFVISLMYGQGGLSPLDIAPHPGGIPTPPAESLYATVGAENYVPAKNETITVAAPQALTFTFTNGNDNGWPPNIVAWTTQKALTAFSSDRVDPFLPIFMIWNVKLDPLKRESTDANDNEIYTDTNLTDYFVLDTDAIDYQYIMNGDTPVPFTVGKNVGYGNSATMSSSSTGVLVHQINSYIASHPNDPEDDTLKQIAQYYDSKKFLSQGISGFNQEQILTAYVAQVTVEDLVNQRSDAITKSLAAQAKATPNDNWYDFGFNSLEPISTNLLAQNNFGPLRSGFMEIQSIEIVDAFGQRMDLKTSTFNPDGSLATITAYSMTPAEKDTKHKGLIYLPPRLLTPTRLWFNWLSATFNDEVSGISSDFVEMNTHPSTSPVCGWVLPNHLDDNLFLYDADGTPIGTFGIEHRSTSPSLVYRTRAGNVANPTNDLAKDIGPQGEPTVNAHLANYMWYLYGESARYLEDLMTSIENSNAFLNPANFAQNAALSVLIGRPLAITRAVVGLETAGNLLPLSQADTGPGSPFSQDVKNDRYKYTDRMQYSSANLADVNFPLRLGDLHNLDDGLVGFIIEGSGSNPYTGAFFYSPAATESMGNGVVLPTEKTLELTLNASVRTITMLIDPRAPVHATTGILPVSELSVPADQYSAIMNSLGVNFVTRPILQMNNGLVVPLPQESGFDWSWITMGKSGTPLPPNAANETPVYGYTPQTILEGWLQLNPGVSEDDKNE